MSPTPNAGIDQDRDRVDVSAEHECEFWLQRFGVTFPELSAAVRNVGARVSDLKRHFGKS